MFGYIYFAIVKSVTAMFNNQNDLSSFTPQTRHHEPNFSFHLANELWDYFSWLNCDFDVTKTQHGNQRPDVIFHRRGRNRYNLLVVEVKRKSNPDVRGWRCSDDEVKIYNDWFQGRLRYNFGVSIVMNENTSQFAFNLFQRSPEMAGRFTPNNFINNNIDENEIFAKMNQLITAKTQDIKADTSEIENEINELVIQLYGLN